MKTYEEITDEILEKGFEVTCFDLMLRKHGIEPFLISQGLKILIEEYGEKLGSYFCTALSRFLEDDFGSMADEDDMFYGYEYGCYESPLGDTPSTGAIMIHREGDYMFNSHIVMYLQFER